MKKSLTRIAEMDALMQELEKDEKILKNFLQKLSEIQERKRILTDYYQKNWLQDLEENPEEMYGILSEDGLYNLIFDVSDAEKEILKKIVQDL